MFGIDKNRFLNIPQNVAEDTLNFKAYVENRIDHVIKMYDRAYRNLEIAQEKQNRAAMQKAKVRNIMIGQRVFLELGKKIMGKSRYIGPFRVIKKVSDFSYEIQEIEKPKMKPCRVSVDRLYEIEERREHLKMDKENSVECENYSPQQTKGPKINKSDESHGDQGVMIVNVPHTTQNSGNDQEDDQNLYTQVQRETDDVENTDPLQNMSTDMLAKFRHQIKQKMNRNKNRSAQVGRVSHKYNLRRRN
jgi:hypothetical protein